MWAYLSIKKLLEKSKYDSKADPKALKKKALDLSLKLTSMVVIQPGKNKTKPLRQGDLSKIGAERSRGASLSTGAFNGPSNAGFASGIGPPPPQQSLPAQPRKLSRPGTSSFDLSRISGGSSPAQSQKPNAKPQPRPAPQPPPAQAEPETNLEPVEAETEDFISLEEEKEVGDSGSIKDKKTAHKCSVNETMTGNNCEFFCNQTYTIDQSCPKDGSCKCKTGFLRGTDGNCVLPPDCPTAPRTCSDQNAELSLCGIACSQETCQTVKQCQQQQLIMSHCNLCGPPACKCKSGYVLSDDNGKCVLESDCA